MNPSSDCRKNIFEEEFRYRETSIFMLPQKTSFWYFCQSGTFQTLGTEILFKLLAFMHWEYIGSFKDESCLIGHIPQLNSN